MAKGKRAALIALLLITLALAAAVAVALLGGAGAPKAAPTAEPAAAASPAPREMVSQQSMVYRRQRVAFFPNEGDWVYRFTYAYPELEGETYAAAAVNDAYQMARDEMLQLILPMFASEPGMYYNGKNEVTHDFTVTCDNGALLSILERQTQTMGDKTQYSMEAHVFDMAGEYQGEALTLRGVTMAGESSDQLAQALMPILYREFVALQESGVADPHKTEAEFQAEFSPLRDFYADEQGNAVFFFPPSLLAQPSFDVPLFPYTAAQLAALVQP